MTHQLPDPTAAMLLHEVEPALPFVTTRSRLAGDLLQSAFEEHRPLVVLDSGWNSGANHLIRRFLAGAGSGISVARVTQPCTTEHDGLQELIRSIGFDPKNMLIANLEKVFMAFVSYQKKRKHRTIVVIEESNKGSQWVRDFVGRMVELEAKAKYGLTLILSRQPSLSGPANEEALNLLSYQTAKHISLTPFTQADTRRFIRWRINAAETANLDRIIDFAAVTLIHELCDGVPDAIDSLCCASLELADEEDTAPVTTDIVMRASRELHLKPMKWRPASRAHLAAEIPTLNQPVTARIILTHNGATISELPLNGQRLSIGRSEENDLCINSHFVSRQHATIFRNGAETAIVDLDSKNGTYVNSQRIKVQTIANQDEISIGHHTLRFIDSNATSRISLNGVAQNGSTRSRNTKTASNLLIDRIRSPSPIVPTPRKSAAKPE